jgi:hypothetical protein
MSSDIVNISSIELKARIYNQAVAWKPQSTVACLINRGYRNIHQHRAGIQVLLQVHDSSRDNIPSVRLRAASNH